MTDPRSDAEQLADEIEREGVERVLYGKGHAEIVAYNARLVAALRSASAPHPASAKMPCATCPNPPSCAEYGACQLTDAAPQSDTGRGETAKEVDAIAKGQQMGPAPAAPTEKQQRNTENNFCRTCCCHFPPDAEDRACRAWEDCRDAQAPQSATERGMVLVPAEQDADFRALLAAVQWILEDAIFKSPEQVGDVARRWLDRLLPPDNCTKP